MAAIKISQAQLEQSEANAPNLRISFKGKSQNSDLERNSARLLLLANNEITGLIGGTVWQSLGGHSNATHRSFVGLSWNLLEQKQHLSRQIWIRSNLDLIIFKRLTSISFKENHTFLKCIL